MPSETSSLDYRGFFVALATARGAKEILAISFISSFGVGCVIGVVRSVLVLRCSLITMVQIAEYYCQLDACTLMYIYIYTLYILISL
jgi:hypothetical protein